jgi:hypothetical protein
MIGDVGINDWGEWKPDEWYWNEEYETWVYVEPKRIRPRDLTNKMEKNWLLGMRRNWNTAKKEKMLAAITTTRANYHLVSMATFYITKPYNMLMLVITFYELSQAYRKLYEEGVWIFSTILTLFNPAHRMIRRHCSHVPQHRHSS